MANKTPTFTAGVASKCPGKISPNAVTYGSPLGGTTRTTCKNGREVAAEQDQGQPWAIEEPARPAVGPPIPGYRIAKQP